MLNGRTLDLFEYFYSGSNFAALFSLAPSILPLQLLSMHFSYNHRGIPVKISKRILALALGTVAGFSQATPIAISNAGFEGPVTGTYTIGGDIDNWVGGGATGVFAPAYYSAAGAGFIAGVTGLQTAYLNGGTVQQTLMSTLDAGIYTLRTRVGDRADGSAAFVGYSVELMAGSLVLASISQANFATTDDGWIDTTLTFISTGSSTDALGIRLSYVSGDQVNFDDVRLDFQRVPEPASLALVGIALLGMGALRRR